MPCSPSVPISLPPAARPDRQRSIPVPRNGTCSGPKEIPWVKRLPSDVHDRSESSYARHCVVQHDVACLDPTMSLEGIRIHAKHPVRIHIEARQEVDERERVEQTQIRTRKKPTQTLENRHQRTSPLKVRPTGTACVATLACPHGRDNELETLPPQLPGCPGGAQKERPCMSAG